MTDPIAAEALKTSSSRSSPHKPAVQQVVLQLLHQLPIAPDRVQHLQKQGPQRMVFGNPRLQRYVAKDPTPKRLTSSHLSPSGLALK